ncbi:Inner membrane protein YqiK [Thalassoglobus neptunius]|uniref:Inner membrane protein YqiK n=1 Tax=Thalassoglobus neptunius TaxID=1938619 RepID=A0A5C5WP24_9PLAN|nr:SPFH domain-containing protein [Thalassoglobus neptunius]TWT51985.1 Inner membrane protein YqiK [Thalassoglobus neptunius]
MWEVFIPAFVFLSVLLVGFLIAMSRFYRKVGPEEALVKTGWGGMSVVSGGGMWVIPIAHRVEHMDLSVKRIEIARREISGLICKDNVRADIEVAFFVRVNNTTQDILQVAQALGCRRASEKAALVELFDAKFSEALKTVGKHFDFVDLYTERDQFKEEILKHIGTDLNGYVLDDCAIDFLEQTPITHLNEMNILDAEGIKKITNLTAQEHIQANDIRREKEKTIKKQDVEAQEAILELEKQRVEATEKQKREIAEISSREHAEAAKVQEEQRLRSESARISTEEELAVAEENMQRQIIVAQKNKERTDAVESERVEKDRLLEVTERERIVGLAEIEKEKVIEVEKRNIQDVIRERVAVERSVVEEQQRIKDTEEFATADREKRVAITIAEKQAEESLVKEIKAAEAQKQAATFEADKVVIEADAKLSAAEKETASKKLLAEARQAEAAADGLAEVQVMTMRADALEKEGTAEATVVERKLVAEAKGQKAKAEAIEKEGMAEATVLEQKYYAEAKGIEQKAEAMKLFDGVGREHEEFKLRLNKDKEIEIAAIDAQKDIAREQSGIVGAALESARIDIVGGETEFFDRIVDSIKAGKSVDRYIGNSEVLTDVKSTFFDGNGSEDFTQNLVGFASQFGMKMEDVKDLSVAALLTKLLVESDNDGTTSSLKRLQRYLKDAGLMDKKVGALGLGMVQSGDSDD